jgi:hypothetical protein
MPTTSPLARRIAPATLFAAAVALGAGAFGYPAVANAERVRDIERYDRCLGDSVREDADPNTQLSWEYICCVDVGGHWDGSQFLAPPARTLGEATEPGTAQRSGGHHRRSKIRR